MKLPRRRSLRHFEGLAGRTRFISDLFDAQDLSGSRLLDVGCGTAWFLQYLSSVEQSCWLVGVDVDLSALKHAHHNRTESTTPALAAGSSLALPVKSNSFDICTTWEVIEHIPRDTEQLFFGEIFRVLSPGGKLFLSTPNSHFLSYLSDPAFFLQKHRHYRTSRLVELALRAGFEIEEITVRGRFADFFLTYNFYFSKWILRRPPVFFVRHAHLVDRSYSTHSGFMTAFIVCRKPVLKNGAGNLGGT